MRIKLFRGMQGVDEAVGITQAVFCDDSGKPIAIIQSPAEGVCMLTTIEDDDFQEVLQKTTFGWKEDDFNLNLKTLKCRR